jgi:aspartyl-tRNA(Asn)/glutamyl-tRNA(Gln) amidotransferase subunit A
LAKTVEDSSLVFEVIAGQDGKDPLSSDEPVHAYSKILHKVVKGLKVGILKNFYDELVASQVRSVFTDAVRVFHSLGMKTEEVSIPHLDLVPAVKLATSRPENACAHDANLRTRVRDYSPQILYSYICALLTPAVVYVNAQRVRCVICDEFDAVFSQVDLLALPTLLFPAPTIEECKEGYIDIDGKRVRRDSMGGIEGYCAVPFNLTGLPAISIPCGFSSSGLPIGMQGVGRDFQEGTVFQAAHAYERAAGWYKRRPDIDKIAEG